MNKTRVRLSRAVLLVLLVPGLSFAAGVAAPVPGIQVPASRSLLRAEAQPQPEQSAPSRWYIAGAVGGMVLTALALGAGGGALVGSQCDGVCFNETEVGVAVGVALGAPLGTYLGGQLAGGRGHFVGPLLGSALGTLVGGAVGSDVGDAQVGLVLLGSATGSLVGYFLSQRPAAAAQPPAVPSPSVQPVVSVSGKGGALGLIGSF